MSKYAANTQVSSDRSVAEMRRTLQRYGAGQFVTGDDWAAGEAVVGFTYNGVSIRLTLKMPKQDDPEFTLTESGRTRKPTAALKAWEQATRQRWRALNLVVKAKLEAVEAGISTFEQEFMAHIVLANGQTLGDRVLPDVTKAIAQGKTPARLPLFDS